eukprot:7055172-Pyramimonas_sp.AAC.1
MGVVAACGRWHVAFCEAHRGATTRVNGVPKWARWEHASAGIWAFNVVPYGAAKRVKGVPNMGTVAACERRRLGFR